MSTGDARRGSRSQRPQSGWRNGYMDGIMRSKNINYPFFRGSPGMWLNLTDACIRTMIPLHVMVMLRLSDRDTLHHMLL